MTNVTREGFCKIRPPQEGVPLCNSHRSDTAEVSWIRRIPSDVSEAHFAVGENFEEMLREIDSETPEG